jgi:hypothetical protein
LRLFTDIVAAGDLEGRRPVDTIGFVCSSHREFKSRTMAAPVRGQVHHLFVLVNSTPEATESSVRVLQFLAKVKPWLRRVGIAHRIQKIEASMLAHPKLVRALESKGITTFPALKTPNRLFLGVAGIVKVYRALIADIQKFDKQAASGRTDSAVGRRGMGTFGSNPLGPAAGSSDPYRDFIASELSFDSAEREPGDDSIGDGGSDSMMTRFRDMQQSRSKMNESRKKGTGAFVSEPGHSGNVDPGPTDNVGDNDLIDRLISTSTDDVTQDVLDRAFTVGGDVDDAREEVMVRAFWENQRETLPT